jgi:hypothetical protein
MVEIQTRGAWEGEREGTGSGTELHAGTEQVAAN